MKWAVRTAVGATPRESHPRVVLTRPYLLPATLLTLGLGNPEKNGASFSYKGVSLSQYRCLRAAYPRPGGSRSLIGYKVMVHHADAEIAECVRCPMMRRRYLAGIFVKEL